MAKELTDYIEKLNYYLEQIDGEALNKVARSLQEHKCIYVLGNGGSQANASHLVLHLINLGFRAHDILAETAWLTACANDFSYDSAPRRYLRQVAQPGDCLVVISGSGSSANVIYALEEAKNLGLTRLGLLGFGGRFARNLCDYAIVLDCQDYGVIEDCHSAIIHALERTLGRSP
jgi:D-sedoheptulose 7-phosphate isomerase